VGSLPSYGLILESEGLIPVYRKLEIPPEQQAEMKKSLAVTSTSTIYRRGPGGYVNRFGQQVIPFQFKSVCSFHQGRAVASTEDGEGLIDTAGNWVVPPGKYVWIDYSDGPEDRWPFLKSGQWGSRDSKWGFLDSNGNEVIPPRFKYPSRGDAYTPIFSEGLAVVADENDRFVAIDLNGNIEFAFPENAYEVRPFSNGLALVSIERDRYIVGGKYTEGGKYGFISTTGEMAIPAKYQQASDFSEGLAPVSLNSEVEFRPPHHEFYPDDKWGYIDTTGKVQIPFKFTQVGKFSNGLAPVMMLGKGWGYINKAGKIVIPYQFEWADDFDHGIAKVWHGGKECFIDTSGKIIVRTENEWAIF